MALTIYFDLPHLYYLPQYLGVITALQEQGAECHAAIYEGDDIARKRRAVEAEGVSAHIVADKEAASQLYCTQAPSWVIFGNDFAGTEHFPVSTKTALLFHGSGTGVKRASLSPGLGHFDVRFVSGPGRIKIFREHFPNVELVEVGFAKLDPLLKADSLAKVQLDLKALGLEPDKPTLLYAPTFYPSSIENMYDSFPDDFGAFNILIKCHDFTATKSRYRHQLKKLKRWSQAKNVYFAKPEHYSLVPFMATADIMVTDTSSAIFEFAALNKPVIICDFVKLRWSYRGPLKYRLNRRLDPSTQKYLQVADSASSYSKLKERVDAHYHNPKLLEAKRMQYSQEIMGSMDGNAAKRISSYLMEKAT